jgi:drug/metabolite transporter (DMT)-like permease
VGHGAAQSGEHRRVGAAMFLLVFIWGVNFSVIKAAFADLPPFVFTAVRYACAGAILVVALRFLERPSWGDLWRIPRRDLPNLVVLGLLGHAAYQVFFVSGLARTTAGNAALILSMAPIFVGVLAVALGLERPTPRMWIGLLLAFAGLLILIEGHSGIALGLATWAGDLLVLISSMCWAAYTVLSRSALERMSSLRLTTVTLVLGLPVILVAGAPGLASMHWEAVRLVSWGAVAFSSIFAVALSYVIWYRSVQAIGGVRTAAMSNLIPVVALVTARIFLGEPLGLLQVVGATVVLLGVWLSSAGALGDRTPAIAPEV